jgi:ribonuclease HI
MATIKDWNPDSEQALVYTDGSASTHSRKGGWAYLALDEFRGVIQGSGAHHDTTISRMELIGPIEALSYLSHHTKVVEVLILSDSQYIVLGFMDPSRARNANKDLWEALDYAASQFVTVTMEHVKGHQGDHFNEIVDKAAVAARKSIEEEKEKKGKK